MSKFSTIKALTFDAAHTLFHPRPSVGAIYQEVMQRHGLDYETDTLESGFRQAFRSVSKDRTILDGERREWSYWRSIVKTSIEQFRPQPTDFDSLFEELWETFARGDRWRPATGAKTTLSELRKRGYQTALLSNWDKRVRSVVDETGFAPLLDHLFISSEIGAEKPDPAIFAHAAAALELSPNEILHVGDSLQHDIKGARAAGWHAIRIVSESESKGNGSHDNAHEIRELSQLLDFL